jgi:hypothetical protein
MKPMLMPLTASSSRRDRQLVYDHHRVFGDAEQVGRDRVRDEDSEGRNGERPAVVAPAQ